VHRPSWPACGASCERPCSHRAPGKSNEIPSPHGLHHQTDDRTLPYDQATEGRVVRQSKCCARNDAMGQKRRFGRSGRCPLLPPKADMARTLGDVRYVPSTTKVQCNKMQDYSITRSARNNIEVGTESQSEFATLRLRTVSNFVASSTGILLGLVPFRILSTNTAACRHISRKSTP